MGDTFSSSEHCKQQYQNAQSINIVADGKIVGCVWGPHAPIDLKYTYTYRIGGMNCCALSKNDAVDKLLNALNTTPIL
jgi:hypothetical protein